jgi:hypothetical protein
MNRKLSFQDFAGLGLLLAVCALVLFCFSCSKLLPTAPEDGLIHGYSAEELWPAPSANLVSLQKDCSARGSEKVGPSGGALSLQADCLELDFIVPSGALSEEVRISVAAAVFEYWQDGKVAKGMGFVFKPDGLVFSEPAQIELQASVLGAEKGEVLRLFWYNPATGLWELEQEVKVEDAQVELEFEVDHFSRYAIS